MLIESSNGRPPSRAALTVAITLLIAIWAVNFLVVKIGLRHVPALTFASFRVVAAGLFMILIAPLCRRLPMFRHSPPVSPLATLPARADGHSARLHDYWTFAYLGFFGVSINQLRFTLGLRYTNVTHFSIIVGMAPIYTLTLAVLFRLEPLTWRKALGMAIAFTGVATLAPAAGMPHHSPTLLGDAITMCGSLGFAMYVVSANVSPQNTTRSP